MTEHESEVKVSERGFLQYPEFTDMYGHTIRVAESSSIDGGIWIFCQSDSNPDPSPHLNRTQTKRLISILKDALSRQSFREDVEGDVPFGDPEYVASLEKRMSEWAYESIADDHLAALERFTAEGTKT